MPPASAPAPGPSPPVAKLSNPQAAMTAASATSPSDVLRSRRIPLASKDITGARGGDPSTKWHVDRCKDGLPALVLAWEAPRKKVFAVKPGSRVAASAVVLSVPGLM